MELLLMHSTKSSHFFSTIFTAAATSAHMGPEVIPLIYELVLSERAPRGDKDSDEEAIKIVRRIKETLLKVSTGADRRAIFR